MRIYVKRENWDGGLWMALPATAAEAQELWRELEKAHPSAMLPFIGGADSRIGGMGESLAGEPVFEKGHLVMLNRLARRMEEMGEEELLLFTVSFGGLFGDVFITLFEGTFGLKERDGQTKWRLSCKITELHKGRNVQLCLMLP